MSKNYIERVKSDNGINIKIHKDGKVCTLTNPNTIKVLLDICHKNNRYFKNSNTIENVDNIIKEFDSYRLAKQRSRSKTQVMPDNIRKIKEKIKLIRKIPLPGKIIISTGLAATLGITGISIISGMNKSKNNTRLYGNHPIIEEEIPEYIDGFEDIEMSSPDAYLDSIVQNLYENYEPEDIVIVNNDTIEIENNELSQMLQTDEFHFSYKDRTGEENISNAKRYEDLFIKYGNMYGVDPNLLIAIAAQESSGDHYNNLHNGSAVGIMQIERKVHVGETISAYNFQTDSTDKITITQDAIEDLETNIQIGTIIFANYLKIYNYNIPLTLQAYNFGPGNISTVINSCSNSTGLLKDDIRSNITNPAWLNYRNAVSVGDSKYVEHVLSYVESGTVLTVKDKDSNDTSIKIVNDEALAMKMA